MRIARIQHPQFSGHAIVEGDHFRPILGDLFGAWVPAAITLHREEVRLLAPVRPSKIVCVGRNYAAHAAEHGAEVPKEPLFFLKPPSAVIGPDDTIHLTPLSNQVEHEAELAVVIGQRARHLTRENAMSVVFGYTCANDVTARDLQRRDGQWTRAKGVDTFAPLGPWIETDLDPTACDVICRVNGEVRQHGHTRDMVFDIPHLLVAITAVMTLEPGDVLLTGTPEGVSPIVAGDQVEVEISGLGILRNVVRA
nr:fumarylacetoacetate hydrolase family protein [Ardenticatena sp.]